MPVENIPVPAPVPVTTLELEERRVIAMEIHAAATKRIADLQTGAGGQYLRPPEVQRFETILCHCLVGRVATDVEGFLTFAREICDGLDREFPDMPTEPT